MDDQKEGWATSSGTKPTLCLANAMAVFVYAVKEEYTKTQLQVQEIYWG